MGIWPWRRKASRRRKSSAPDAPISSILHSTGPQRDQGRHEVGGLGLERNVGGRELGHRKSRRESKKLQRNPEKRAYSFSPGRNDTIRIPQDIHREHPIPPLPSDVIAASNTDEAAVGKGNSAVGSQNGIQEWHRVPTLHKRSGQELLRRKSSKKRKEDHDREAEIKAMSASMPTRAATEYGLAGRPMKKDSKRMRGGLLRNFTNPSSDISLPVPESLHSSMSSDSERYTSYELKGIDLFSPHPTIRRSENPRFVPATTHFSSDGSETRRKLSDRMAIPEEALKASKRIDDLADGLDSGSLRELMERDQRRRERKRISEQQKMERKLARRAEKQRMAEAEAARTGTRPPLNTDRGVFGRELVGLGIAGPSNVKRGASDASLKRQDEQPADIEREDMSTSEKPTSEFQRSASLPPTETGSPVDEQENPIIGTAQVARLSRASMSPPSSPTGHTRGASNISEMMDLTRDAATVEKPEPSRTSSETSTRKSARLHVSWTSLFKRPSKMKRYSAPTQTSFSNTSRDSTITPQAPPIPCGLPRTSLSTGVPGRTMSRFREDLPDFPLSPPDSRIQSPEADSVPPIRTRHDTPTSGYRSAEPGLRLRNETPTSDHRSNVPSPEPTAVMTQSLASIDSEGSWLSGRPRAGSKRGSAQLPQPLRDSASSSQKRHKEDSQSVEELGTAEDEYFSRLTPGPEDSYGKETKYLASSNLMASSDEEDGDSAVSPGGSTKWGAVGRQPTVIHHQPRAKSREVLLNDCDSDSMSEPAEETMQELDDKTDYGLTNNGGPTISRATSVDLGKGHVKHISAGSARLLDLKPRPSGESKRLSAASVS